MPAVSKAQQRFFGACSHGADWASCPKMPVSKMKDFARTKTKNLPERKMFNGGVAQLGNLAPLPKQKFGTDIIPAALTPDEMVLNDKQQQAVMPIPGKEKMLRGDQLAKFGKVHNFKFRRNRMARQRFAGGTGGEPAGTYAVNPELFPGNSFLHPDGGSPNELNQDYGQKWGTYLNNIYGGWGWYPPAGSQGAWQGPTTIPVSFDPQGYPYAPTSGDYGVLNGSRHMGVRKNQ